MGVRVRTGGRLHFGFMNLSLAHDRLYGGLGVALAAPELVVTAEPADAIDSPPAAQPYVRYTTERLGIPGAAVRIDEALPQHAGLGSGTQLALAVHTAIARAVDRDPDPRAAAPDLDRGGRSGVGVATFEAGGFVIDAGHPVERFTAARPARGEWTVPPVAVRHDVPAAWRFLLVRPDADPGLTGVAEDETMRSVVERADPGVADRISAVVTRRVLPALATEDIDGFGAAIAEVTRLNGIWYAGDQGGVYRPPVGQIVDRLHAASAIMGAGQSSWGPTVYGVTDADRADAARAAGRSALDAAGLDGTVTVVQARNTGAAVESSDVA